MNEQPLTPHVPPQNPLDPRRVGALVYLLHGHGGRSHMARVLGVSDHTYGSWLRGERRPSLRALKALRRELGEDGWRFATRQTDTLTAPIAAAK